MKGPRYSDEQVAQVCHAASAALQAVQEPDGGTAPSGPWLAEEPDHMRIVTDGVRNARRGITPREHHGNWVAAMRGLGWTLGPKDPESRTHPNLKDYDDLSPGQRDKDRLFLSIVTALTLTDLPGRLTEPGEPARHPPRGGNHVQPGRPGRFRYEPPGPAAG